MVIFPPENNSPLVINPDTVEIFVVALYYLKFV